MSPEPENLVLQLLRDMRAEIVDMRAELKSDMHGLRAGVASDLLALEARQAIEHKRTQERIVELRRGRTIYQSSVVGHGVFITEHDERLDRVEQHLDLPPPVRAKRPSS